MDIASSLLVPDWSTGSIRGNQGVARTPLSYIFDTRPVGFFYSRPDTKCVPVRAFSHHRPIRFLDLPSFAKSCPRAARSDRAPRNLRRSAWRVTGEGSVGSLPWACERRCREFQPAPVQAASRSCRTVYIARGPQFPQFPTQNGPTGYPRRPRRAAVVISRRQTPESTSRGTK